MISKPALPPQWPGPPATAQQVQYAGVGGEINVFTATAQTLYSLHKLSPSMCASIQRWVNTTFMYGAPDTQAVFWASKRGPYLEKNISYDNYFIKTLLKDFPNHTVIDVFLPNFFIVVLGGCNWEILARNLPQIFWTFAIVVLQTT